MNSFNLNLIKYKIHYGAKCQRMRCKADVVTINDRLGLELHYTIL